MRKFSRILAVAACAATVVAVSSTAFAGFTLIDARTCVKVKDLKVPSAITYATNPATVGAYTIGSSECTIGKISQVCLGSTVEDDNTPSDISATLCCFKAKCTPKFAPNAAGYTVSAFGDGTDTFNGDISIKTKPSTVCVQCNMQLN